MSKDDSEEKEKQTGKSKPSERREFLLKSAVMLAALSIAPAVAEPANAASRMVTPGTTKSLAEARSLQAVFDQAIASGDVQGALAMHGQGLTPQAKEVLGRLTPADLNAMKGLQGKLGGLRGAVAGDNNGNFGM